MDAKSLELQKKVVSITCAALENCFIQTINLAKNIGSLTFKHPEEETNFKIQLLINFTCNNSLRTFLLEEIDRNELEIEEIFTIRDMLMKNIFDWFETCVNMERNKKECH